MQKQKTSQIPVIMLTALEDEYTQVSSFDCLADDYMTKPFSMVVLGKRITALLRRAGVKDELNIWKYGVGSIISRTIKSILFCEKISKASVPSYADIIS